MRKFYGWLLALVMLCIPVLGLAEEIDQLPETYDELCEMLPDMPVGEPENIAVSFPMMGENGLSNMEIYCDDEQWAAAMGKTGGFSLEFEYDEKIGAYVMDLQSQQKFSSAAAMGELTGYIAIGNQDENGWIKNVCVYFGNEAMGQIAWNNPDEWKWNNVTDSSTSNYLMPCIRGRKKSENGIMEIWWYADHTEAIRYDADGNEVEKKTYTEYSEFCKHFMPFVPTAQTTEYAE